MLKHSLTTRALVAALAAGPLMLTANAAPRTAATVGSPSSTAQRGEREITIPAGTQLRLRLDTGHASDTSRVEERVQARLAAPVVVNGRTVLPANSEAIGHVTVARPSAKVKGRAYLAVRFTEVQADDERYRMTTRTWGREAPAPRWCSAPPVTRCGCLEGRPSSCAFRRR
jgi:hypothetical protein